MFFQVHLEANGLRWVWLCLGWHGVFIACVSGFAPISIFYRWLYIWAICISLKAKQAWILLCSIWYVSHSSHGSWCSKCWYAANSLDGSLHLATLVAHQCHKGASLQMAQQKAGENSSHPFSPITEKMKNSVHLRPLFFNSELSLQDFKSSHDYSDLCPEMADIMDRVFSDLTLGGA